MSDDIQNATSVLELLNASHEIQAHTHMEDRNTALQAKLDEYETFVPRIYRNNKKREVWGRQQTRNCLGSAVPFRVAVAS